MPSSVRILTRVPFTSKTTARMSMLCGQTSLLDRAKRKIVGAGQDLSSRRASSCTKWILFWMTRAQRHPRQVFPDADVRCSLTSWMLSTGEKRRRGWHCRWRPYAEAGPGGRQALRLPDGAEDPARWGHQLDSWVIRHRERADVDTGEHPVSGWQRAQSLPEASAGLVKEGRELTTRGASMAERFAFYERKAALLEQIAAADPDDPAAEQAALAARRQVEEAHRRVISG